MLKLLHFRLQNMKTKSLLAQRNNYESPLDFLKYSLNLCNSNVARRFGLI